MTDYERFKAIFDQIDVFLGKSITSANSEFVGWRTKAERFLRRRFGEDSRELKDFLRTRFSLPYTSNINLSRDFDEFFKSDVTAFRLGLEKTKAVFAVYLEELKEENITTKEFSKVSNGRGDTTMNSVFIVHGHNEALKFSVARLLEKQGIEAIILNEQPNRGATIIEKFEKNSNVGAAICLFTADDIGKAITDQMDNTRARQNVVFEAGFFMGSLGRDRVILMAERGVELPSDLKGVVFTDSDSWQIEVLRELKSIGFQVDYNKCN